MAPRDGWLARQARKIKAQEPSMRAATRFIKVEGRGMTDERLCGAAVIGSSYWRGCRRRGHETYVHGKRALRCWQHDPLRDIDEGEEAYREHTR